ncbi:MAG: ABC transporter permease [Spirochaetaceae bacterium]|nr:ABC transporter permease [Spirochaetaceae bacterium]
MRAYVIRRVLLVIPTLFLVSALVFLSVRFIPGDIIDVMSARMEYVGSGDINRELLRERLGIDRPVYVQYARWVSDILLHGTLGESLYGGFRVEERLAGRLGITVELGLVAVIAGLLIALPVGIYSAIRQYTAADYVGRSFAILGLATPNFWIGLMVMIYPAIWWGWTPPMTHVRFTAEPWENLRMFIIPSLILGTYLAASTMRMTRTMMLEVLRQDYVRTAWAKGLRERRVVLRHAVKNALIPVVTLVGLQLPIIAGGSVIIENIFNLPGLGRLMLIALNERDYPVISGVNLFFATVVVLVNLVTDLTYAFLDPRIRYE